MERTWEKEEEKNNCLDVGSSGISVSRTQCKTWPWKNTFIKFKCLQMPGGCKTKKLENKLKNNCVKVIPDIIVRLILRWFPDWKWWLKQKADCDESIEKVEKHIPKGQSAEALKRFMKITCTYLYRFYNETCRFLEVKSEDWSKYMYSQAVQKVYTRKQPELVRHECI